MNRMSIYASSSMPPLPAALSNVTEAGVTERPGKRERTRSQLLQAAVEVLSARGVAGAGIQEIARVAGVAPGTVYNHFSTREEIVSALGMALITALNERIVLSYAAVDDGAERMAIGMRRFLWLAQTSPQWTLLLLDLAATVQAMVQSIEPYPRADLQRALEQGRFRYLSEDAALHMAFGAVFGAMTHVARGKFADPQPYADEVVCMVLQGLGMRPAGAAALVARPLPAFVGIELDPTSAASRQRGRPAGRGLPRGRVSPP